MASSTTIRKPEAPATRRTVDDPTRADRNAGIVLVAAVIAMGLLAGLNYDWAITVMPALTAADDRTLVDAMQQSLDNPAFPLTFLAPGVLAAVALVQARRSGSAHDRTLDRRRPRALRGSGRRHRRDPHPAQRRPQERR